MFKKFKHYYAGRRSEINMCEFMTLHVYDGASINPLPAASLELSVLVHLISLEDTLTKYGKHKHILLYFCEKTVYIMIF